MILRDAHPADYEAIIDLNAGALPHVNLLDLAAITHLDRESCYFRLARDDEGTICGFLLGLDQDASYDSPNFRWFVARYPRFVYIDRVIVDPLYQRRGIGHALYSDVQHWTENHAPLLACEVNIRPLNAGSMVFHEQFGFVEVGQQDTDAGAKRVRLMVKSLRAE